MPNRAVKTALLLFAGVSLLQCAAGPSPSGRGRPPRGGKLASDLHGLAAAPDRAGFAASRRIPIADGRVRVIVFMAPSATGRDRERLAGKHGAVVEKTANGLVRASVPVDALLDLSADPAVSFVALPDRPGR